MQFTISHTLLTGALVFHQGNLSPVLGGSVVERLRLFHSEFSKHGWFFSHGWPSRDVPVSTFLLLVNP